ncbi:MAG: 2Fe-2S iron-sulfur cluster-binding protein, partial [Jannaschia sp.]
MTDDTFLFDRRPIPFRHGQSVAAALTEAGQKALRQTAKGADRGMFCGMGVCQDCLVTVDGMPNQRACMTLATPDLSIRAQVAFPVLEDMPVPTPPAPARILSPDIAIIGAGAGGLSAAIAARAAGASVVVLDERKVGGGQYYKQSARHPALDAQQAEGAELLDRARASGAEILGSVEIWGAFDGPLFLADIAGAALIVRPRTAIVATGAYERPRMVPGWTLPGVMTTGAAQTLWRSYRTLPGKRVAVCGSGPLNAQVALELAQG